MKIFRYIFFFISFLFFASKFSLADTGKTDSLLLELKKAKHDTIKVTLLLELGSVTYLADPTKSIEYFEKAKNLSEDASYSNGLSESYGWLGYLYQQQGDFSKALDVFEKCMNLKEAVGDKKNVAYMQNNIGMIYQQKGDLPKALDYYHQSLKILEVLNDSNGFGYLQNNLGYIYQLQNNLLKALEYYQKSLQIRKAIKDKKGTAESLNNIGRIYQMQGDNLKALEYYQRCLNIHESFNDQRGISYSLKNLGSAYQLLSVKGNADEIIIENDSLFNKALECFHKGLVLSEQINDKSGIAYSLNMLGSAYYVKKDYKNALSFCLKSLEMGEEVGVVENIKRATERLSQIYASLHQYKEAYDYHKKFSSIKDSLLNESSSKQITEMQTKYETEKKEQQITLLNKDKELQDAQLNRQRIVIWSVAGGLLVVLILSIFIFRERRKSEKLLLNILPVETARELKRNGKATAKHYESVTVMFTDFKGFTTIAEKLSAEELVSELDFLFKKFDEIISKYPVEKIKTIGDAYMCAGGLPTANTTNAMDVVSAAIEIQNWMTSQNSKWNLRIGIHTGPVTAGVVGDKKFAYDIWGDTVNTASRMESSGEAGKINISGSTYEFISPLLEERGWGVRHRGKISAKNKGEIEMYFVEKPLS